MRTSAIMVSAVVLLSVPALADKTEPNSFKLNNALIPQSTANFAKAKVRPGAPKALKRRTGVKKVRKIRRKKRRVRRRRVRIKKVRTAKAVVHKVPQAHDAWWRNVGTPAIETFRDCIAGHAAELASSGKPVTTAEFVKQYMNPACGAERDRMVKKLKAGLGEKEYKKVSEKLIDEVFVPAIVALVDPQPPKVQTPAPGVKQSAPAAPPAPKQVVAAGQPVAANAGGIGRNIENEKQMRGAKSAMFRCFRQKADYLSAHNTASPAERVALAVVNTCKSETDRFFQALHQLFHASPQEQETRKFDAINHTYKPAIEKRIRLRRRAAGITEPPNNRVADGSN